MTDQPHEHMGQKSSELRAVREAIKEHHALWGWGTEKSLIPWTDRWNKTMLVFWESEEDALAENAGDEDNGPDEHPVHYPTAKMRARIPAWIEGGVEHIGLQPKRGRILYTLTVDEFAGFLDRLETTEPDSRLP